LFRQQLAGPRTGVLRGGRTRPAALVDKKWTNRRDSRLPLTRSASIDNSSSACGSRETGGRSQSRGDPRRFLVPQRRGFRCVRSFAALRTVNRSREAVRGSGSTACRAPLFVAWSGVTRGEIHAIDDMVTSPAYRHVPTRTLAVFAQRRGIVCASPSTWYRLVRTHGWRRPRLRLHPTKPKLGLRTTRPNEVWHIDPTVIRLLDGSRAYLHAVIDNFSRRILAWHVAGAFAAGNSVTVLLAASEGAASSGRVPVVLADAGVEDVMRSRPVAAVGMRPRGHGPGRSPCFCLRVAMYASIGRAATAVRLASEQYPASASTCVGVSPDWPSRRPGGQQRCSNLAIETAVTLGLMFRLPLRQTEGFVWSIVTRRSRGGGRC